MGRRATEQGRSEKACPDRSLIERAKKGEDRALDLLIRRHQPVVARRVMQMCRNDADVEDIVQEVMITLYLRLDGFEGRSSLATWLYRVATNAFLLHERRRKRDRLTFTGNEPYEEEGFSSEPCASEGSDGFRHVYERELLDSVSRAVDSLPDSYRQVLLHRRRDGLSLKEVSRLANITVSSVKSRQYRANQMLKERISLDGLHN